jgi:RNA polymerase sigma factor (TIGR02999 family)
MDSVTEKIYGELRHLARSFMRKERRNHTLTPTELFHEAYFRVYPRLSDAPGQGSDIRAMFAIAMRRVLIDHARKRNRRNNILPRTYTDPDQCVNSTYLDPDRLAIERIAMLEEVFDEFSRQYPEHAKIVTLKIYDQLSIDKIADTVGLSQATVMRRWTLAKAILMREIQKRDRG